ncbi:MAG TPA: 1,2-phenylacetyl-CoA epoxidase subunit PaaC [Flavobacteriales bacterium]
MNKQQEFEYLLRIADNALIHGHRLSEWCGHGPVLEEDIALTNTALDLIGQATNVLKHAAQVEGAGRDEDQIAFLRDAWDFRNLLIVELPNGDYAYTIAKQFFFSTFYALFLEQLMNSKDEFLRAFAEKTIKEVRYHVQHSSNWVVRMGDGTEESKQRIQKAVDALWEYTPEFFMEDELDVAAKTSGYGVDLAALKQPWYERVKNTLEEATLIVPQDGWGQRGGKQGRHTEHLGYILAEMQFLQRAYPGAKW